jgi:site-specific DNA-methyltransferase (cytosine-N4-specific)
LEKKAGQVEYLPARVEIKTDIGAVYLGDSMTVFSSLDAESVNLVVTSPPFGLVRKKEYGNVDADEYLDWFRPFAAQMNRVLKSNGSLVVDIGGAWEEGLPTRHLYHFELLVLLCREYGFHLAQEFYWWNPSKLPTPAEWVNVRRIRVKDAVNTIWWLSKSPWPKADNRRVLQQYSEGMSELLEKGYRAKKRPSGHNISKKFQVDNGGAIPPNLLAIANTESNSAYMRYCREKGLKPHPARFPSELPEFFIRMLTDEGDLVVDPFAGSCVTGEVSERLKRKWICAELRDDYVEAARGRFVSGSEHKTSGRNRSKKSKQFYRMPRPSLLWDKLEVTPLAEEGGAKKKSPTEPPASSAEEGDDRDAA